MDFTFEATEPPVALEVTSLADPEVAGLNAELLKMEARLQDAVRAQGLGSWMLGVRVGTEVRRLEPAVLAFLRSQSIHESVASFDQEQAPPDLSSSELRCLVDALDRGLLSALRQGGPDGLWLLPPAGDSMQRGFGTLLRHAVEDNTDKLAEARPCRLTLRCGSHDPGSAATRP